MRITNNKKKIAIYKQLKEELEILNNKDNKTEEDILNIKRLEYSIKEYFNNTILVN